MSSESQGHEPDREQEQLLGMAILATHGRGPFTLEQIAAYCGVSRERIMQIERRALEKCRRKLREVTGEDLAGLEARHIEAD